MNQIDSSAQLRKWDHYREFLKKELKAFSGEGPCFVSKDKLDFEIEGKPWRGHAFLAGPKVELSIQKLRKEGIVFKEGTLRSNGKELEVQGLLPKLAKEGGKTLLKLRLGWKVAGVEDVEEEGEEGAEVDLEAAWLRLKTSMTPLIRGALTAGASAGAEIKKLLQEASEREKAGDFSTAVELLTRLGNLLTGGTAPPVAPAASPGATGAAPTPAEADEAKANLEAAGKSIRKDVGQGGVNDAADVLLVQRWLNNHGVRVRVSGECDAATIQAIRTFQTDAMKMRKPDGLVEARGNTERNLKRKPVRYDGTAETETEERLQEFFKAFDGIRVRTNPGQEPPEYASVVPPYHINEKARKENALEARKKNPAVLALLKEIPVLARVGKADPDDIQFFLERSIEKKLVTDKTQKGLRDYLAKYGVSTDCSGLVGQALNFLTDGNVASDPATDAIDLMNTGANSMKGGEGRFDKVTKPGDLKAGDTMHVPGHIRILVDVDRDGERVLFRTVESTPTEDVIDPSISDGRNDKQAADGGTGDVLWLYEDPSKFANLQRSPDGGKTWKASGGSVTYGRWKGMPAATP